MNPAEELLQIGQRVVWAVVRCIAWLLDLVVAALVAAAGRRRAVPAAPPVDLGDPGGFEQVALLRQQMHQMRNAWPQPPPQGRR